MAPPLRLTKGTKEYYPVRITSALGALTTLTGADVRYDIYKADDAETLVILNLSGDNDGMIALCMIDTTSAGLDLDEGKYNMYISFEALPEQPRKGPFPFIVDD